jgi:hypothetical protein
VLKNLVIGFERVEHHPDERVKGYQHHQDNEQGEKGLGDLAENSLLWLHF